MRPRDAIDADATMAATSHLGELGTYLAPDDDLRLRSYLSLNGTRPVSSKDYLDAVRQLQESRTERPLSAIQPAVLGDDVVALARSIGASIG